MKKLLRPLALVLVLGVLAGGALAASGDGPVSLRYLIQVFFPQAVQEGEEAANQMLEESYDAASAALAQLAGGEGGDSSLLYSADLRPREWYDGQMIGLTTGSGVLLVQGAASVTHNGAVVDVTEGTEVLSGRLSPPTTAIWWGRTPPPFSPSSPAGPRWACRGATPCPAGRRTPPPSPT